MTAQQQNITLPAPMKLFGGVRVVEDFDGDRLAFFEGQQRSRKLSVMVAIGTKRLGAISTTEILM